MIPGIPGVGERKEPYSDTLLGVDLDKVWKTAVEDVPALKAQLEEIIAEIET